MDLANKQNLIKFLKEHQLWAKKGLSQTFLVDRNALEKIVEAGEIKKDDLIVEIGPGLGTLTQELVKRAGEVVAVELDQKLVALLNTSPILSLVRRGTKFKIINADILKINLNEIIGDRKYKVIANIPYHITSKVLELFLARENKPELMVLLVQKEVAERICAQPGAMSVLSVSVQLFGKPEIVGIVKKESFFPSPKIDSAILKISDIRDPFDSLSLAQDDTKILSKQFFRTVKIGFASRRKTLANNLSAGYHIGKEEASDIIKTIGLSDKVRAQELSIKNWRELCQEMEQNHN